MNYKVRYLVDGDWVVDHNVFFTRRRTMDFCQHVHNKFGYDVEMMVCTPTGRVKERVKLTKTPSDEETKTPSEQCSHSPARDSGSGDRPTAQFDSAV